MLDLQRVPVGVYSDFKFNAFMQRLWTSTIPCTISRLYFPLLIHLYTENAMTLPEREAESLEVDRLPLNSTFTGYQL